MNCRGDATLSREIFGVDAAICTTFMARHWFFLMSSGVEMRESLAKNAGSNPLKGWEDARSG